MPYPLFVARRRPRLAWALPWALGAALLLGPPTLTVAQPRAALPNLGGGVSLTLGDERRLGQQIMPSLHNSGLVVEDPLLNQYLADLWRPVFATARAR